MTQPPAGYLSVLMNISNRTLDFVPHVVSIKIYLRAIDEHNVILPPRDLQVLIGKRDGPTRETLHDKRGDVLGEEAERA